MFTFDSTDATETLATYGDTDLHEIAHEIADGSQYVIYPIKAWELLSVMDPSEIAAADAAVADNGMLDRDTGLLDHACIVAYWIIYHTVLDQLELVHAEIEYDTRNTEEN